jgi:flagellar biosynthesis/type III secretory pathway chaperone
MLLGGKTMESSYERLLSILQRELELNQRLLALLGEEKTALRDLKAKDLLELANEKDGLALQLKALEESRRLTVETIVSQRGGPRDDETPTLAALSREAPEALGRRLDGLRQALRETIEAGQQRNDEVRFLANHSLEVVREAMSMVARPLATHQTYKPKGGLGAYQIAPQVMARQA